jgi:hypothetical protein
MNDAPVFLGHIQSRSSAHSPSGGNCDDAELIVSILVPANNTLMGRWYAPQAES